jgi:hypothetical protein
MIRQVSYTYLSVQIRIFLLIILVLIFSSCSFIENSTESDFVAPLLPGKSKSISGNTSEIKIKQIEKSIESTDVEISLSYSLIDSEYINVRYGKEPKNLTSSKKIPVTEVYAIKQLDDVILGRIRLKDIGAIEPLYVSIAIVNKEGIESEYSEPFLVVGDIKPNGAVQINQSTDTVGSVSPSEKQIN